MKIGLTTKEILINQLINQLIDHLKNLKMKSFKSFKRVVKTSTLDAIRSSGGSAHGRAMLREVEGREGGRQGGRGPAPGSAWVKFRATQAGRSSSKYLYRYHSLCYYITYIYMNYVYISHYYFFYM